MIIAIYCVNGGHTQKPKLLDIRNDSQVLLRILHTDNRTLSLSVSLFHSGPGLCGVPEIGEIEVPRQTVRLVKWIEGDLVR